MARQPTSNDDILLLLHNQTRQREEDSRLLKTLASNITTQGQRLQKIEAEVENFRSLDNRLNDLSEKVSTLSIRGNKTNHAAGHAGKIPHSLASGDVSVQRGGAYSFDFTLNSFRQLRDNHSSRDSSVWHLGHDNRHLMARVIFESSNNTNTNHVGYNPQGQSVFGDNQQAQNLFGFNQQAQQVHGMPNQILRPPSGGQKRRGHSPMSPPLDTRLMPTPTRDKGLDTMSLSLWSSKCSQANICSGPKMHVNLKVKAAGRERSSQDLIVLGEQVGVQSNQVTDPYQQPALGVAQGPRQPGVAPGDAALLQASNGEHVIDLSGQEEWVEWWRCTNVGGGCDELLRQGVVSADALVLNVELVEL